LIYYGIAFLIGGLVIIAPLLNGRNAARIGTLYASFFNYLFATISALVIACVFSFEAGFNAPTMRFETLSAIPATYFLGGIIGCMIILMMNSFTVRIKAFYIVILPFMGQMTMGLIIDQLNGKSFDIKQTIGIILIIAGLVLSSIKLKGKLKTTPHNTDTLMD